MLRDLPGVADVKVGNRLLAPAEPGGQGEPDKLARLRRGDRESHRPESVDFQAKVVRPGCELDAERRLHVTAKHPGQPVARRGRHLPFLPETPPSAGLYARRHFPAAASPSPAQTSADSIHSTSRSKWSDDRGFERSEEHTSE